MVAARGGDDGTPRRRRCADGSYGRVWRRSAEVRRNSPSNTGIGPWSAREPFFVFACAGDASRHRLRRGRETSAPVRDGRATAPRQVRLTKTARGLSPSFVGDARAARSPRSVPPQSPSASWARQFPGGFGRRPARAQARRPAEARRRLPTRGRRPPVRRAAPLRGRRKSVPTPMAAWMRRSPNRDAPRRRRQTSMSRRCATSSSPTAPRTPGRPRTRRFVASPRLREPCASRRRPVRSEPALRAAGIDRRSVHARAAAHRVPRADPPRRARARRKGSRGTDDESRRESRRRAPRRAQRKTCRAIRLPRRTERGTVPRGTRGPSNAAIRHRGSGRRAPAAARCACV